MAGTQLPISPHETRALAAGSTVFAAHDDADVMYVVVSGEVDIVVDGDVLETVPAGGVFGEIALIDGGQWRAAAVVRTDAEVFPVGRNRFRFLVASHPDFALEVMATMASRLRAGNLRG